MLCARPRYAARSFDVSGHKSPDLCHLFLVEDSPDLEPCGLRLSKQEVKQQPAILGRSRSVQFQPKLEWLGE